MDSRRFRGKDSKTERTGGRAEVAEWRITNRRAAVPNIARRHLTNNQHALAGAKLANIKKAGRPSKTLAAGPFFLQRNCNAQNLDFSPLLWMFLCPVNEYGALVASEKPEREPACVYAGDIQGFGAFW